MTNPFLYLSKENEYNVMDAKEEQATRSVMGVCFEKSRNISVTFCYSASDRMQKATSRKPDNRTAGDNIYQHGRGTGHFL